MPYDHDTHVPCSNEIEWGKPRQGRNRTTKSQETSQNLLDTHFVGIQCYRQPTLSQNLEPVPHASNHIHRAFAVSTSCDSIPISRCTSGLHSFRSLYFPIAMSRCRYRSVQLEYPVSSDQVTPQLVYLLRSMHVRVSYFVCQFVLWQLAHNMFLKPVSLKYSGG